MRKKKPQPRRLPSRASGAARRSFERWVSGITEAPTAFWEPVVDAFLAEGRPTDAEAEGAILLLALLGADGQSGFLEGSWILHGVTARHLYFDGSGWGDVRTLELLGRFLSFVIEAPPWGTVDAWDAAYLRAEVARARLACDLPGESGDNPTLRDFRCHLVDLPILAQNLAPKLSVEARPWTFAAIKFVAEHARVDADDRWFRFGRLHPEALAATLYFDYGCSRPGCDCESDRFRRGVHEAAAALYRYLGDTGKLSRCRADELARRLEESVEGPDTRLGWAGLPSRKGAA
ncbi:MAG: hypothetical protein DRJ42_26830 [Deltaproteobacteria bacterium]|nr:MAG: hypothetical protein DRJ42_26830 [Deltaproteobacteria bacterium]